LPLANPAGTVNAITVGLDGDIWYSELLNQGGNVLGRIDPATGAVIGQYSVNSSNIGITGLAAGPDNGIWFTDTNAIGRLDAATGTVTGPFTLPSPGGLPLDITLGPDNNLWFTIKSTDKIGKITTSGSVTEYALPSDLTDPGVIRSGPNGTLFFSASLSTLNGPGGRICEITTDGQITKFPGQVGQSSSAGIASSFDGNLWVTDGPGNRI